MAILKAHNSFLRANGKILDKVKSSNIYQLNIDRFNDSTLYDGEIYWLATDNDHITKFDDYINISFSNFQLLFKLPLEQFNIDYSKTICFEYELEFPIINFCYGILWSDDSDDYTLGYTIGSNIYFTNSGIVIPNGNYTLYKGQYGGRWGRTLRFGNMPHAQNRQKIKLIMYPNGKVDVYIDDELCITADSYGIQIYKVFMISNGANEARYCNAKLYAYSISYIE